MKIHEYQAKEILRRHGIPVPDARSVRDAVRAREAAAEIIASTGRDTVVVKAQIHAGGRGKGHISMDGRETGGGVRVVSGAEAAAAAAREMLGGRLFTAQNPAGQVVDRLLVEAGVDVECELYLAALVDRAARRPCFVASREGGMEIEAVAAERPEAIAKVHVNPVMGFTPSVGRRLAIALGLAGEATRDMAAIAAGMHAILAGEDASMVEVNPLALTRGGRLVALDAKITLDQNADFRHPERKEIADPSEENPVEREARAAGLSYVKLEGDIGCLVNGAGLAMATMDIIEHEGGNPANFLDVGGSASKETVARAFGIILSDPNVKAILVNIFGGIMSCRVIAEGVVQAARSLGLAVPLIVRIEGNEVEAGKRILAESGLAIVPAADMADAARKVVAAARGGAR